MPDTQFPEQKQLFERRILSFQGKNSCLNAGYSVSGDGMYALPAVYFTSAGRAPPSRMPFSTASHMSL